MRDDILTLTEREKETLRLLVRGHDAKSIARHFELSVHTINERLRDARRKLNASSSREAARLLAEAERGTPDFLADKHLGVSANTGAAHRLEQTSRSQGMVRRFAWVAGGMFIMSLLIAAIALSSVLQGSSAPPEPAPAAAAANASTAASLGSASEWLALVDRQNWEESWRTAATLFKSQITAQQWTSMIQAVRQPLGRAVSRTFHNVTKTDALPGAPAGKYEIIQFQTDFTGKGGAIETVVLAQEASGWRVAGYFIR